MKCAMADTQWHGPGRHARRGHLDDKIAAWWLNIALRMQKKTETVLKQALKMGNASIRKGLLQTHMFHCYYDLIMQLLASYVPFPQHKSSQNMFHCYYDLIMHLLTSYVYFPQHKSSQNVHKGSHR